MSIFVMAHARTINSTVIAGVVYSISIRYIITDFVLFIAYFSTSHCVRPYLQNKNQMTNWKIIDIAVDGVNDDLLLNKFNRESPPLATVQYSPASKINRSNVTNERDSRL